ncbi:nitroreductase family protein, partial [Bordetella holmesii]|nr:nitroreductase family protein [Bordetella holmesii]
SSFTSPPSRAGVLFGAESETLWALAADVVRKVAPADGFEIPEAKLKSFAAGDGTVLFFEAQDVVRGLPETCALYAHNFAG